MTWIMTTKGNKLTLQGIELDTQFIPGQFAICANFCNPSHDADSNAMSSAYEVQPTNT